MFFRGCGGRRVGGGGFDGDAAVGDVEEGDEVGAELDADEALEVRVAHDVGGHVADVGVEALRAREWSNWIMHQN